MEKIKKDYRGLKLRPNPWESRGGYRIRPLEVEISERQIKT